MVVVDDSSWKLVVSLIDDKLQLNGVVGVG